MDPDTIHTIGNAVAALVVGLLGYFFGRRRT